MVRWEVERGDSQEACGLASSAIHHGEQHRDPSQTREKTGT